MIFPPDVGGYPEVGECPGMAGGTVCEAPKRADARDGRLCGLRCPSCVLWGWKRVR